MVIAGQFPKFDEMTPKERERAIAENRPYDRIPHGFGDFFLYSASKATDIKVSDFHLDSKKQIEATVTAYRKYGLDGVGIRINFEEVLGATFEYPDYREPYVSIPSKLEGPNLEAFSVGDPKRHPKLQIFWDVVDGVFEAIGDESPISLSFRGPFSVTAAATGTEWFLRRTIRNPDYVHQVLDKVTDAEISFIESLTGYDVRYRISDPIASGTVLSAKQYQTFVKPYQKRFSDAITRVTGRKPHYHICGNTSTILRDMVETGAGALSVDNLMDLEYVGEQIGASAGIVGNVDPSGSMLLGTPEIIRQDLRNCLKKGSKAKGGYLASFGCGLPLATPESNLYALFEAFREYGKYPFDPERL